MSEWVQVNVALERTDEPALAHARRVFDGLSPLLDSSREDGRLRRFHFMRKPPDIRLRLEGPAPHADLVPAIEVVLRRLADEGSVADFFTGVYEPEVRLFGGHESMSLVHDYFDVDSLAWMDHDRLQRASATRIPVEGLTTAVVNELFALTLDDSGEVWDSWCNVGTVVGTATTGNRAVGPALVQFPEDLMELAFVEERAVLERYRSANDHLAAGLRALWRGGQLQCGLRGLIPFVAVFHFHRYGLDAHHQAAQATAMQRAWNPRRGMKGVE